MRPPPRQAVTAVILAGGQGRRLGGRDKSRLRYRGETLLNILLPQLRRVASEVIVVRRRPRDAAPLPTNCRRAWDRAAHAGPVAGLEAGLRRARRRWCLCLPVDGPVPPASLLSQLARNGGAGAFARHAGNDYYLHCLVPRSRHRQLARFLDQDGRSAANACRSLGLRAQPVRADRHTIWSINTRSEWRRLQRLPA